jgi:hypothetical protein
MGLRDDLIAAGGKAIGQGESHRPGRLFGRGQVRDDPAVVGPATA